MTPDGTNKAWNVLCGFNCTKEAFWPQTMEEYSGDHSKYGECVNSHVTNQTARPCLTNPVSSWKSGKVEQPQWDKWTLICKCVSLTTFHSYRYCSSCAYILLSKPKYQVSHWVVIWMNLWDSCILLGKYCWFRKVLISCQTSMPIPVHTLAFELASLLSITPS